MEDKKDDLYKDYWTIDFRDAIKEMEVLPPSKLTREERTKLHPEDPYWLCCIDEGTD